VIYKGWLAGVFDGFNVGYLGVIRYRHSFYPAKTSSVCDK